MTIKRKIYAAAILPLAIAFSTSAMAQDSQNLRNVVKMAEASAPTTPQNLNYAKPVQVYAAANGTYVQTPETRTKRRIKIVREPLKAQSKTIYTINKGSVIIVPDKSNDSMRIYKPVEDSAAMPNLFKN